METQPGQDFAPPEGLPPAHTQPLPATEAMLADMPRATAALAGKLIEHRDVYMIVRTGTKTDVGSWLARGRVWLIVLDDALAVVAAAPAGNRPLAMTIPLSRLNRSRYNHVTVQLVLSPETLPGIKGLAVSPIEGSQVLAQVYHKR